MHLTGNRGEWSEIYVLFRLLAEGKIFAANSDLEKLSIYFPVQHIYREETKGHAVDYELTETIRIFLNDKFLKEVDRASFSEKADQLLHELKQQLKGNHLSFPLIEDFMNDVLCYKISSSSQDKADIILKILDVYTGYSPVVGFSIKSKLGNLPTLFNASQQTNFLYQISLANEKRYLSDANTSYKIVNPTEDYSIKSRVRNLLDRGFALQYRDISGIILKDNLILIDSLMDRILAESLIYFYSGRATHCLDIVRILQDENPLGYRNPHAYAHKFKKFLTAVALGMKPSKIWDGLDEASGGYIVVKEDGDVLAYHIYNRNHFEDYLLNNTKFDTPSSSRHKFGKMISEDGNDYIKLNLQIRFK